MAYGLVPILHAVAALLAIVELGMTGYLVSYTYTPFGYYGSPSRISFMLFSSIWTLLILLYVGLTPLYLARLHHKLVALALDALTMLFWFAGSIAVATLFSGPGSCGADSVCHTINAAVAFGFFLWYVCMLLEMIKGLANRDTGQSLWLSSFWTAGIPCARAAMPRRTPATHGHSLLIFDGSILASSSHNGQD